jgi:hypothetical protein
MKSNNKINRNAEKLIMATRTGELVIKMNKLEIKIIFEKKLI